MTGAISFSGLGSGMDTKSIVDALDLHGQTHDPEVAPIGRRWGQVVWHRAIMLAILTSIIALLDHELC